MEIQSKWNCTKDIKTVELQKWTIVSAYRGTLSLFFFSSFSFLFAFFLSSSSWQIISQGSCDCESQFISCSTPLFSLLFNMSCGKIPLDVHPDMSVDILSHPGKVMQRLCYGNRTSILVRLIFCFYFILFCITAIFRPLATTSLSGWGSSLSVRFCTHLSLISQSLWWHPKSREVDDSWWRWWFCVAESILKIDLQYPFIQQLLNGLHLYHTCTLGTALHIPIHTSHHTHIYNLLHLSLKCRWFLHYLHPK